jgi:hypothetical protein
MAIDGTALRALGDALAWEDDNPDNLLPTDAAHALIRSLLVERDERDQIGHIDEAAAVHWRLRLLYGEISGYRFGDNTQGWYYAGPTLCRAARWLAGGPGAPVP